MDDRQRPHQCQAIEPFWHWCPTCESFAVDLEGYREHVKEAGIPWDKEDALFVLVKNLLEIGFLPKVLMTLDPMPWQRLLPNVCKHNAELAGMPGTMEGCYIGHKS